jgi:hypothetical protein
MNAIFYQAGFEQIQATSVELNTVYTNEAEWWSSLWSVATRRQLEKIEMTHGSEGLEHFKARSFSQIRLIQANGQIRKTETAIIASARKALSA